MYWLHMKRTFFQISFAVLTCFILSCSSSSSRSCSNNDPTQSEPIRTSTYLGTQNPGDVWTWTIEINGGTGSFTAINETLGFNYAGNVDLLPNNYLRLTYTSSTEPEWPIPSTGYAFEVPNTALIVKLNSNEEMENDDQVVICAGHGSCLTQDTDYNWMPLVTNTFDTENDTAYGIANISLIENSFVFGLRRYLLDGTSNGIFDFPGFSCNDGRFTNTTDPLTIGITPSGVLIADYGPNAGGLIGIQVPDNPIDMDDLMAYGREFRGVIMKSALPEEGSVEDKNELIWFRTDNLGKFISGGYTDFETGIEETESASLTLDTELSPGIFRATMGDNSMVVMVSRIDERYFIYGIGAGEPNVVAQNFLVIEVPEQQYTPNSENLNSPLGTNLVEYKSYHPEYIFTDIFPKTRKWISGSCDGSVWDTGEQLDLDANGWVTDAPDGICPHTLMLEGLNGHYPSGTYVLLWEGEGTFSFSGDASSFTQTGPGRATIQVNAGADGIRMRLTSFNRANPLRNIRMIMPGGICGYTANNLNYFQACGNSRGGSGTCAVNETCFDLEDISFNRFVDPATVMNKPKAVFHPDYLNALKRFRLLRFMDWMRTNNSEVSAWEDRALLQDQTYTSDSGMPYEMMVALSNILNADSWVNIPHQATDDYNLKLANYFKENLNSHLKVYVEYSNEVWNQLFSGQYNYANTMGEELELLPEGSNPWDFGRTFYSFRTVEVTNAWKTAFESDGNRVVRVMGSLPHNTWWTNKLLVYEEAYLHVDAVAIAPYFYGVGETLDELFVDINGGQSAYPGIDGHLELLSNPDYSNLELITYEGGQHLLSPNVTNQLVCDANRDPRMGETYTTYLNYWKNAGGGMFVNYTSAYWFRDGQYGAWGMLEYQNQPRSDAPKYDALMSFIDNNPCWWEECQRSTGNNP